jgi:hypothetical protein
MNDNGDNNDNVVHLNVVNNDEQPHEEKSRASVVEVLEEMLELAREGEITEMVSCTCDKNGQSFIHVSTADWLGAVGLFEVGKHIFVTQYTNND